MAYALNSGTPTEERAQFGFSSYSTRKARFSADEMERLSVEDLKSLQNCHQYSVFPTQARIFRMRHGIRYGLYDDEEKIVSDVKKIREEERVQARSQVKEEKPVVPIMRGPEYVPEKGPRDPDPMEGRKQECDCKSCTFRYLPIDHPRTSDFWDDFVTWWSQPGVSTSEPCVSMTYEQIRVHGVLRLSDLKADAMRDSSCRFYFAHLEAQKPKVLFQAGAEESSEESEQEAEEERDDSESQKRRYPSPILVPGTMLEQVSQSQEQDQNVPEEGLSLKCISDYQVVESVWVVKERAQNSEVENKNKPGIDRNISKTRKILDLDQEVDIWSYYEDLSNSHDEEELVYELSEKIQTVRSLHRVSAYYSIRGDHMEGTPSWKSEVLSLTCIHCNSYFGDRPARMLWNGSSSCGTCYAALSPRDRRSLLSKALDKIIRENDLIGSHFLSFSGVSPNRVFATLVRSRWIVQRVPLSVGGKIELNSLFRKRNEQGRENYSHEMEQVNYTHYRVASCKLSISITALIPHLSFHFSHEGVIGTSPVPTYDDNGFAKVKFKYRSDWLSKDDSFIKGWTRMGVLGDDPGEPDFVALFQYDFIAPESHESPFYAAEFELNQWVHYARNDLWSPEDD